MARGEKIWLKRANIPLWIVQLICLVIFTGGAGVALYAVERVSSDYGVGGDIEHALEYAHIYNSILANLLTHSAALGQLSNWPSPYSRSS